MFELNPQSVVFMALTMQAFGTLFVTVQLWGPAWGLEKPLRLTEGAGPWRHLVRDGLLLHIAGFGFNIVGLTLF